jgi:hypothetical protein
MNTKTSRATREAIVIEFMAGTMCSRMRQRIENPTCRSPIPGEGLPEDEWCVSCIARSVVEER